MLDHFRSRTVPFYSSFDSLDRTIAITRQRFPEHVDQVLGLADRILRGSHDLLGYRDLYFKKAVPDWHFDPISGKTSPRIHWSRIEEISAAETGDKKVIWELNRHQYFATLGQAYLLTGDERYAETFSRHLSDWFDNNPPKIGVNWLSSLELAFRSISWIWAFHFFKDSSQMTGALLLKMLMFMRLNGRHLETYLSTYFSPNTHLTGEALGLYYLGSFLPELPEASRWKELGYKILLDTFDVHVGDDGVYCEQSSHYHRYTADFYSNLLILRSLWCEEIEPKHRRKLELLFDHMLHITQPNGKTPLFGDDDGGRLFFLDSTPIDDFRPTMALGATLFERGDLKYVAPDPSPELLWLLGQEGLEKFDSIMPAVPTENSRAFANGGIFAARNSWDSEADHIVIDCGPHGFLNGGHAHADALNVIVSFRGFPLFIDSGTFNYTSDLAARDRFRSTAAHNCLTVNGKGSSEPAGPFSWRTTAKSSLVEWSDDGDVVRFAGASDGFREFGVDYAREVEFSILGGIAIHDRIASVGENSFELNFILAPKLEAKVDSGSVVVFDGDEPFAKVEASISGSQRFEWLIEDWSVSFRYGSVTPTKRLRLMIRSSGNFVITNSINHL